MPLGIPHSVFLSWSPLDQDKAMAWTREQRKVCNGCGTRKSEWDHDRDAYIGDIQYCEGCARIEQERENAAGSARKGLHVGLVPRGMETTGEEI